MVGLVIRILPILEYSFILLFPIAGFYVYSKVCFTDEFVMNQEDFDRMASVFKGLAHPTRLAVIQGVQEGATLKEITTRAEVTRGTLQDHLEMLLRAEILYQPRDGEQTYALTPVGEYIFEFVQNDGEKLAAALAELEEEENAVVEQIETVSDLPINQTEVERAVHTQKWEMALSRVDDILEE